MRQILWLLLFSSILFCFATWFVIIFQDSSTLIAQSGDSSSYHQANNLSAKNALLKNQIYNQLRIALPKKRLESIGVTLLQDGTLRIQRNAPIANKLLRLLKILCRRYCLIILKS